MSISLVLQAGIDPASLHYQCSVLPLYYKSIGAPPPTRTGNTLLLREPRLPIAPVGQYMAPLEGFEPPSDTLEECCLVQLDHSGMVPLARFEPALDRF